MRTSKSISNEKPKETIFLVDDDKHWLAILCESLEITGHNLKKITDPGKVIEMCRKFKPSLIVLDVVWKKEHADYKDGFYLAKRIHREFDETIPIIFLTALDETYELEALEIGAIHYIQKKGFQSRKFQTLVDNIFSNYWPSRKQNFPKIVGWGEKMQVLLGAVGLLMGIIYVYPMPLPWTLALMSMVILVTFGILLLTWKNNR